MILWFHHSMMFWWFCIRKRSVNYSFYSLILTWDLSLAQTIPIFKYNIFILFYSCSTGRLFLWHVICDHIIPKFELGNIFNLFLPHFFHLQYFTFVLNHRIPLTLTLFSGGLDIFRLMVQLSRVKELFLPKGFYGFYDSVSCIQSKNICKTHILCFQGPDLQIRGWKCLHPDARHFNCACP